MSCLCIFFMCSMEGTATTFYCMQHVLYTDIKTSKNLKNKFYTQVMWNRKTQYIVNIVGSRKEYVSSVSGTKPLTFKFYSSTVRSSTVAAPGKLQLHFSQHRKLQSPHHSLPTGLFSPRRCPISPSTHNWTVCVWQTPMPCLTQTHPLCYQDRNLCQPVLFVHNASHLSERRCTNISAGLCLIITHRSKTF